MDAHRAVADSSVAGASPARRLDLKALRFAVHGWWLGNPLVYKPGSADLAAVARALAEAGAASGTLVLDDQCDERLDPSPRADATTRDAVRVILIVRPPLPRAQLSEATAQTIQTVVAEVLDRDCHVDEHARVMLDGGREAGATLATVSAEDDAGASLVDLTIALGALGAPAPTDDDEAATPLFERSDWREVFLARVLHTLDGRLQALGGAPPERNRPSRSSRS